jgi:hypothetical protein
MPVFGLLAGAGAVKSGYGHWVVGAVAVSVSTYFGAIASAMLTRYLATRITQIRRCGSVARSASRRHAVIPADLRKRPQRRQHATPAHPSCVCWKRAA